MPAGEILPSPHGTSLAAPDLEQRKEMGLSPAKPPNQAPHWAPSQFGGLCLCHAEANCPRTDALAGELGGGPKPRVSVGVGVPCCAVLAPAHPNHTASLPECSPSPAWALGVQASSSLV